MKALCFGMFCHLESKSIHEDNLVVLEVFFPSPIFTIKLHYPTVF